MSENNNTYQAAFFVVPSRILELPGLTIQLLRFYETIFSFWNHGKKCFLKNDEIKKRTGMTSDSTISDAFQYFEKHNEMKRIMKGTQRFIQQPTISIKIDNDEKSSNDNNTPSQSKETLAVARPAPRRSESRPLAVARHNNNKLNKEINNKPYYYFDQKQNMLGFSDVTKQSTSAGYQCETEEERIRKAEEQRKYYNF